MIEFDVIECDVFEGFFFVIEEWVGVNFMDFVEWLLE